MKANPPRSPQGSLQQYLQEQSKRENILTSKCPKVKEGLVKHSLLHPGDKMTCSFLK